MPVFEEETSHARDGFFDIRTLSVIKIDKLINLEIYVAECDHAISNIKDQIEDEFGDEEWETAARSALADFERRKALAIKKIEALKAERAEKAKPSAEAAFARRFVEQAKKILPDTHFEAVFDAAAAAKSSDTGASA